MFAAIIGLLYLLVFACGIASLVFFIMVVMQMFKRDQSNLGIICIVTAFCAGIGTLIAFVYGWMKATEWNIKKTMTYWTVALVSQIVLVVLLIILIFAAAATMIQQEMDFDPNNMNLEFEIDDSQFNFEGDFNMPDDAAMPEEAALPEESSTDQP